MASKVFKKGDRVRLNRAIGGDRGRENTPAVVINKSGSEYGVNIDGINYAASSTMLETYELPKVGDKVRCIDSGAWTRENSGGGGWELGREFTVENLLGDGANTDPILDGDNTLDNCGVYSSWVEIVKPKPLKDVKVTAFKTNDLDKHDILGQDKITKQLNLAAEKNIAALIVGDTGSGKTTIVKSIADKRSQKYIRFNLTGETTVDEFVGKYVLRDKQTIWEDGVLLAAMKAGHWLIVDEINVALPEILFVLHSLLDDDRSVLVSNHNGEIVKPKPSFRFFGTMNPVDEYAGTKDLNKAFKSRFGMILNMDYPTAKIEAQVVASKGGVSPEHAMQIVDVGQLVRKAKKNGDCFYTCSTRDLIQWAQLVGDLGLIEAFEVSVLNKANGDRDIVLNAFKTVVKGWKDAKSDGVNLNIEELVAIDADLKVREEQVTKKTREVKQAAKADLLKQLVDKSDDEDLKKLIKEL